MKNLIFYHKYLKKFSNSQYFKKYIYFLTNRLILRKKWKEEKEKNRFKDSHLQAKYHVGSIQKCDLIKKLTSIVDKYVISHCVMAIITIPRHNLSHNRTVKKKVSKNGCIKCLSCQPKFKL